MFCIYCGKEISKKTVKFCPYCGGSNDVQQSLKTLSQVNRQPAVDVSTAVKRKPVLVIVIGCIVAAVCIILLMNPFSMAGNIKGTYYHASDIPFTAILDFDGKGRWEMNRDDLYMTGTYKQRTLLSDEEYVLVTDWWERKPDYSGDIANHVKTVKMYIKVIDEAMNMLEGKVANEAMASFLNQSLWTFERREYTVGGIYKIGDRIKFGEWRGEPIEWRVLQIEDWEKKALLISEKILCVRRMWHTDASKNWDEWLNTDFAKNAFEDDEWRAICEDFFSNDWKIFMLSADEAEIYFNGDEDRIAHGVFDVTDQIYIFDCIKEDYEMGRYDSWNEDVNSILSIVKEETDPDIGQMYTGCWLLNNESYVFYKGDIPRGSEDHYTNETYFTSIGGGEPEKNHYFGVRPAIWVVIE